MSDLIKRMQLAALAERNRKSNGIVKEEIRRSRLTDDETTKNSRTIQKVVQLVNNLDDFYRRRDRAHRYHRGDQYLDLTEDDDGGQITEENLIRSRGMVPLSNNKIESIINNLVGQYRQTAGKTQVISRRRNEQKTGEMLTNALQTAWDLNQIKEIDAQTLKEGLISGVFSQKIIFDHWKDRDTVDLKVKHVNPGRLFFNGNISDIRMLDIDVIGELHDVKLTKVLSDFADTDDDIETIKGWYRGISEEILTYNKALNGDRPKSVLLPDDPNLCRVIEIWENQLIRRMWEWDKMEGKTYYTDRKPEDVEVENNERRQLGMAAGLNEQEIQASLIVYKEKFEHEWGVKFLTPHGQVLYEGPTPYKHKSHPYIVRFAKFVNGEVWGVVESIIDQQRYINRLITLTDTANSIASKNLLMIHEDSIPNDMDINDYVEEFSKIDGVIKFTGTKDNVPLPQQIKRSVASLGQNELLAIQFDLIEKISGVSGAIQGQEAKSGTPSALYAQQVINASTNSRDVFDRFTNFRNVRDMKSLKVITQFYKENRYLSIVGSKYDEEAMRYDPDLITEDLEYDLITTDGVDTPAYRMVIEERLTELLKIQAINIDEYLKHSSYPFSDDLLESRRNMMQNQQAQMPQVEGQGYNQAEVEKAKEILGIAA